MFRPADWRVLLLAACALMAAIGAVRAGDGSRSATARPRRPRRSPDGTSMPVATTVRKYRRARASGARYRGVRGSMRSPATAPSAKARAAFRSSSAARNVDRRQAGAHSRQLLPFAVTLWDYINRAMPMPSPHTLPTDDVYALTAYILNLNDTVPDDFVANKDSLPQGEDAEPDSFSWVDPRPDSNT